MDFNEMLSLLKDEDTWEQGLEIAKNQFQNEFETHFGYNVMDYGDLIKILKTKMWSIYKSLGNIKELNLKSKKLKNLPSSIGLLSSLRYFDVEKNQLTTLPESIKKLQNLEGLSLSNNQFISFPEEIKELQNLRGLNLSHNQLTTLPKSIKELRNLRGLNLSNNQFVVLPEFIAELERLRELYVYNNQLNSLPLSLKNHKKCKICVGENPTEELHGQVYDWKNVFFSKLL